MVSRKVRICAWQGEMVELDTTQTQLIAHRLDVQRHCMKPVIHAGLRTNLTHSQLHSFLETK